MAAATEGLSKHGYEPLSLAGFSSMD